MRVKIAKWGNSTAVRIPQAFVDQLDLKAGEEVDITLNGRVVQFVKPTVTIYMTLDEMIAEMKRLGPENEPETLDWGPAVGSEIIEEDDYSLGLITPETMARDAAKRSSK